MKKIYSVTVRDGIIKRILAENFEEVVHNNKNIILAYEHRLVINDKAPQFWLDKFLNYEIEEIMLVEIYKLYG